MAPRSFVKLRIWALTLYARQHCADRVVGDYARHRLFLTRWHHAYLWPGHLVDGRGLAWLDHWLDSFLGGLDLGAAAATRMISPVFAIGTLKVCVRRNRYCVEC